MASNYIVINSKFKPFSYDEMVKPVNSATTEHKELENNYAELSLKANIWDKMADEQKDPESYAMYKNYANDLNNQADILASTGLNPTSRKNMLDMKSRYSSDIMPIEQAYKRRQELTDEQRKLLAQDNTLMFNKDASTYSLDDLIHNPMAGYKSYSGALIMKQAGAAAQNLARSMRENPEDWQKVMGNQYWRKIQESGYSPEEILNAINDENAPQELKQILNDSVASSGISSWNDKSLLSKAYEYAAQGLWNAIGTKQEQIQSNKAYDYAMREQAAQNAYNRMYPSKTGNPPTEDQGSLSYRTLGLSDVARENEVKLKSDIDFINSVKNDNTILNKVFVQNAPIGASIATKKSYNNLIRLNKLVQKYGVNEDNGVTVDKKTGTFEITDQNKFNTALDSIIAGTAKDINSNITRHQYYVPNITSYSLSNNRLYQDVAAAYTEDEQRGKDHSGVYELKNGKIQRKPMDLDDISNLLNASNVVWKYSPATGGITVTSTYGSGNDAYSKSAVFDISFFDTPAEKGRRQGIVGEADTAARQALKDGDMEAAKDNIAIMMDAIYAQNNSLAPIQPTTDASLNKSTPVGYYSEDSLQGNGAQ